MKKGNRMAILLGVILAMLLAAIDQTVVATAMPRIVTELNGLSHLSWVFTAYMLAATVTIPIYGKLSDIYGRRGFFLAGIGIFLLGSVLSGISQNMMQLIVFRGLQGIGAGTMMVNALAVIGDIFSPAERAKWQGLMGGVFALASVIGPLLGGWLTDQLSWRWIFYINIPLGLVAGAVLAASLPEIVHDVKSRSIDFSGALFIVLCLVPLLLALVWGGSQYAWGSTQIIALLAMAAISLVAFALVERKAQDPIISLDMFKNRVFVFSILATFLSAMGVFGAVLYIPLFAQGVTGISATSSGLILMPMTFAMVIASAVGGQIISRTGNYKVLGVIGMAIAAAGMFLFSKIGVDTTSQELTLTMIMLGIGLGATMPLFIIAMQNAFDRSRMGEVTASAQLFRSLGGTVGTAILGGVMNAQLARNLTGIQNEPFVGLMKQFDPTTTFTQIDGNTVQQYLGPSGQEKIKALIAQAPPPLQDQLTGSFNQFLETIKIAFSSSIDQVYLIGTIVMAAAFVAVLFLPQVRLRKDEHTVLQETALKLDEELGQADKRREPEH